MDCDQVFMILTRGPFPAGEPTDEQVESHLETCGDCWRLAEALRPALEVFQEAVPAIEGRELPGYWGDARPTPAATMRLTSTAARRAPAKSASMSAAHRLASQSTIPATIWRTELLPAIAMASAMTAVVVGLVIWLRG
jgi:hypothetical protein